MKAKSQTRNKTCPRCMSSDQFYFKPEYRHFIWWKNCVCRVRIGCWNWSDRSRRNTFKMCMTCSSSRVWAQYLQLHLNTKQFLRLWNQTNMPVCPKFRIQYTKLTLLSPIVGINNYPKQSHNRLRVYYFLFTLNCIVHNSMSFWWLFCLDPITIGLYLNLPIHS